MYICSMKPLRSKLLCLLFLAGSICGHARTVISQSTREPIIYAGVGVINRNLGTVTDTSGHFSLKIPAEFINDSIRISSVGYVARTFAVRDIATIPDTIALADDVIMLRDVVVKPRRIKHLTAGRKGSSGFIYIEVEGDKVSPTTTSNSADLCLYLLSNYIKYSCLIERPLLTLYSMIESID